MARVAVEAVSGRLGLAVAALVVGGCVPAHDADRSPPPEITWVGPVRATAEAAPMIPLPGLRPYTAGDEAPPVVFATEPGRPWIAVGYRDVDLAGLPLPDPARMLGIPLSATRPDGCWQLPTPAWSAPLDDSARDLEVPAVATTWMRVCPDERHTRRWSDLRCTRDQRCGLTLERPPGLTPEGAPRCVAVPLLDDCPSFSPQLALQHDGTSCLLPESLPPGCEVGTNPEGGVRWTCGACTADTYPVTAPPALTVRTASVGNPIGPRFGNRRPPGFMFENGRMVDLLHGRARAVAVRGEVVAVVVDRVGERAPSGGRCPFGGMGDTIDHGVELYDADTLTRLTRSSSDAACIADLAPDPHGPGFVVAYYRGEVLGLARVDLAGRWSDAHTTTRTPPPDIDRSLTSGQAMMAVTEGVIVVAEETDFFQFDRDFSWIHGFDARTLAPRGPGTPIDDEVSGLAALGRDRVVLTLVRNKTAVIRPVDDLALRTVNDRLLVTSRPSLPTVDGAGRVFVSDLAAPRAVYHLSFALPPVVEVLGLAHAFEEPAMILNTVVSTTSPDLPMLASALVPADQGAAFHAVLLRIERDGDALRVLPGAYPVMDEDGLPLDGPILDLTLDARGRAWGVAPWAGKLVRISPAP